MTRDLEEILKELLLKNIVIEAKTHTLQHLVIGMISSISKKSYEDSAMGFNAVFNEFIEREKINNPLFQEAWAQTVNDLMKDLPAVKIKPGYE